MSMSCKRSHTADPDRLASDLTAGRRALRSRNVAGDMQRSPITVALALLAAIVMVAGCGKDAGKDSEAVAPVAAPITADPPAGRAHGTMIMVHGGGWAGHDVHAQQVLMEIPGKGLLARGWRVVSVDTKEGKGGLQNVLETIDSEIARKTSNGPMCLYGESSGAHLALVAAARRRAIDCVIGLGTPTDLPRYESEGPTSSEPRVRQVAAQIKKFFGSTSAELAPWNPVGLASSIRADVLLLREGDDPIVSPTYAARFQAASPGTKVVELDPGTPAQRFVHGTISARGRAQYAAAIDAFVATVHKGR
jgi:acetyl esterase/lipase